MKMLKTKLSVLAMCSAFMLPTAVSAATADDSTKAAAPLTFFGSAITQTNVHGVLVPGIYINFENCRVAFVPDGVGIVVVDKNLVLPQGSKYLD
ncbi:hypothetical protein SD70_10600 [Gordoniibacillus kamchatkensis]|uniref:Uncharacterized protein n=2 Tax=Gordoniibacillus kamchatkensis TaxID=1590651 RepID=A0ABR5AIJ6_9BACL|nr:hypothetical protein SD70_10600 [Paenibacillus sp. VKM B-2647]